MNPSVVVAGKLASKPWGRRVAIITGGSQGIGAGLVSGFRREGYAVVATSRSIGAADEADYVTVRGDIAEAQTARKVVEQALNRFSRIDCLSIGCRRRRETAPVVDRRSEGDRCALRLEGQLWMR